MSTQSVTDFLHNLANDETMREQLFNNHVTRDQVIAALVAGGGERGFVFDREDVESVLASAQPSETVVLDEQELQHVVGGVTDFEVFLTNTKKGLGLLFGALGGQPGSDSGGGGGGLRG